MNVTSEIYIYGLTNEANNNYKPSDFNRIMHFLVRIVADKIVSLHGDTKYILLKVAK